MMLVELAAGLLLALVAAWYVMGPVLRPRPAAEVAEDLDFEEDLSPRTRAVRALKEIEFDRATGKLADADYDELKAQYTAEALAAMRAGDVAEGEEGAPEPGAGAAGAVAPVRGAVCPVDGPRPETDAEFCSACGRRLASAPGFCRQCGAALEIAATFCNACGFRVAA